MSSQHEIVLLGANQGGIPLAHYLLQHTIPKLNAIDKAHNYHLTIVSPNADYYWKIAAPRAVIDAKQIPASDIIKPIDGILKRYPASSWQHLLGKATGVEPSSKTVAITLNDGTQKSIQYGSLIVATGVHYDSALYTTEYGTEALKKAHGQMHASLPNAKSIIIAGGGPVGVETAGEIATNYPNASISLYSGASRLLERNVKEHVSAEAERQLKALGVTVIHNVRVADGPSGAGEAATVAFNDGSSKSADIYINAIAARQTAQFLPEAWLEKSGVRAEKDTFRVKGPGAENVYALGDVNANSNGQSMWAADGVRPLASVLAIDALKSMDVNEKTAAIEAATPEQRKGLFAWLFSLFGAGKKHGTTVGTTQQNFKTMEGMLVVPIGKSGTGIVMNYKVPGWFVHMMKGKNYLLNFMPPYVSGEFAAKE